MEFSHLHLSSNKYMTIPGIGLKLTVESTRLQSQKFILGDSFLNESILSGYVYHAKKWAAPNNVKTSNI